MTKNRHTILYAEDDLDDVYLVRQAFEAHDHITVVHTSNGREALEKLDEMLDHQELPCLVILDMNMPVMNGRETLIAIRNNLKLAKLAVCLFTTSSSPADKTFAQSMDAMFMTKPIDFTDLEQIALQFVDQCNFEINKIVTR